MSSTTYASSQIDASRFPAKFAKTLKAANIARLSAPDTPRVQEGSGGCGRGSPPPSSNISPIRPLAQGTHVHTHTHARARTHTHTHTHTHTYLQHLTYSTSGARWGRAAACKQDAAESAEARKLHHLTTVALHASYYPTICPSANFRNNGQTSLEHGGKRGVGMGGGGRREGRGRGWSDEGQWW
jgi:hypothetical protein